MAHEYLIPNPWMMLPFGALLVAIALGPLWFADWWARHYPKVAVALGAVTLAYYLFGFGGAARATAHHHILHTAEEYFSFIVLIGSLYVVAGGIHIAVKGEATPRANVMFLLVGALVANLLGTTGASMLLIRPWIRMNKYRITGHHIVFFIFLVSNVGGCLTPIGDPPLFLGYLKGIPFWWVAEHCWPMWLTGVGTLLGIFYLLDRRNYLRAPKAVRDELAEPPDQWRFEGLSNLAFLAVILGAVFLTDPPFLREALMLAAATASYVLTRRPVHEANHFTFHPIQEVAILFLGIFATMMPALDWLQANAARVGVATPGMFYWSCGTLSSVLDNAPTYLSFLSASFGMFIRPEIAEQLQQLLQTKGAAAAMLGGETGEHLRHALLALEHYHPGQLAIGAVTREQLEVAYLLGNSAFNRYLVAISVAAVFFGANTYIGNGPNFMVKAIADHQRVHAPGFLGYIFKFSLPCLLPVWLLVWWLFFRT